MILKNNFIIENKINCCAIVLNYKNYITTVKCVEQILNYASINKIIVVDNKSTDGSYEKLKEKFGSVEKVRVIITERNGGYSYGNNFGFKYAIRYYNPKYFFVFNPDVNVSEKTIKEIVNFYRERSKTERIGIISAKMITNSKETVEAWKLPSLKDDFILSIGILEKLFGNPTLYSKKYLSSNKYAKVDVLPGSFFFINSNALRDINFFDEQVFLFGEERIMSYKLIEKKYQNYLLTKVEFYHKCGDSINNNIKNHITQYILLQKSRKHYYIHYLRVRGFKLLFFNLITCIGVIERYVYLFIKKIKKRLFALAQK